MGTTTAEHAGRRRRLGIAAVVLTAVVAAALGGWYLLRPGPEVKPPEADLNGVDPAVALAVRKAADEVSRAPRSGEAWARLGMILSAHNFRPEARTSFARAEQLDPKNATWPYLRGVLLLTEDPDQAVAAFRRAAGSSDEPVVRLRLAKMLLDQGRLDEVEGPCREVLEREPEDVRAHLVLARLAFARGDWQGCRRNLGLCLGSPSARKAAHALLAQVEERLDDQEGAAREAGLAAPLPEDAAWPDPFVEKVVGLRVGKEERRDEAGRLLRAGRVPDALALLNDLVQDYPDDAGSWDLLGQTLLHQGDPAAAGRCFRRALAASPDRVSAHFYLGVALLNQGDAAGAAGSFREAVRRQPGLAVGHAYLGRCLAREGDRAGAIRELTDAIRYEPQVAEAHAELGELLAANGQRDAAIDHLRRASRLEPEDLKVKRRLDELLAGAPTKPER